MAATLIKAHTRAPIECPECGGTMYAQDNFVVCLDPYCELSQKRFARPTVELEELPDPRVTFSKPMDPTSWSGE